MARFCPSAVTPHTAGQALWKTDGWVTSKEKFQIDTSAQCHCHSDGFRRWMSEIVCICQHCRFLSDACHLQLLSCWLKLSYSSVNRWLDEAFPGLYRLMCAVEYHFTRLASLQRCMCVVGGCTGKCCLLVWFPLRYYSGESGPETSQCVSLKSAFCLDKCPLFCTVLACFTSFVS